MNYSFEKRMPRNQTSDMEPPQENENGTSSEEDDEDVDITQLV